MAMMKMYGVSHITNTATATALLLCLYAGTILRRRSLNLCSGGSREKRKFQLRCVSASDSLQFDFSPPPIDHDLLDTISVGGGKVSEDGIVESFDNDDEALDAFDNGVVVVDLSHFGRIRVSGDDRAHFLHNQTTANFESLNEGQGCDTVFVTPTARTIDIAHAWIMKNAILLTVSPTTCQNIIEMLNKYIFFADKVEIKDITKQTCLFALAGPKSVQIMSKLNLGDLIGQPYGKHQHYSFDGMPITVGVGSLISDEGFTMLMSPGTDVSVWKTLLSQGAIPMGSVAWEKLRIIQGRPAPERELGKDFNVLEAGLWNSISLNKGCYKGQETIARLITYDGIKQRLCELKLSAPAEPGRPITVDGKKVGKLTSYTRVRNESGHFGLGYMKRRAALAGNPKLHKILFLDDDVVVQKDVTGLWKINLDGKVNGAVETCFGSFHRYGQYLNFTHPLIKESFNPNACAWAFGMNIFDLDAWRREKCTDQYHYWQNLNEERTLWKLGTLPPGLITFYSKTKSLDKSWHVLGLGYNPGVSMDEIRNAAVIHYNGNMKPWLDIAMNQYKSLWTKYVDNEMEFVQMCNFGL